MGRPKHASYFKPQSKTANIRRVTPGAFAHYQANRLGQQLSPHHAPKFDAWGAKLAAEEQYYGDSFLTFNLPTPPPSEALMDNATAFLNGVLSDLRAMDVPMLTSSISTDFMDCDPTPDELMDIDDGLGLDYMDIVSIVPDIDASLASVPMDIVEDHWSMAIDPVLQPPFVPPNITTSTDYPVTPPKICPAAGHCSLSAELSLARRELAVVAQALQRLPVWALQSPEPSTESPVQRVPDIIESPRGLLLSPATISSDHPSLEPRGLCIDSGVEVVVEGMRILDISDDPASIWSEEPIPLIPTLPEIQPELLSPCSEPSNSSQGLDTFDYVDLLGLDSAEPLYSPPVEGESGKSLDPLGVWADIADLQSVYYNLPICDLPDDNFIIFPSGLVREVVDVLDLPPIDCELVTDVLSCSEAKADEPNQFISSEINDKGASADIPYTFTTTSDAVTVPRTVIDEMKIEEDGKLGGRIDSEYITQMMKNRAERDAKKKARKIRAREKRRREASPRAISGLCSLSAPGSLSPIKINASTLNPSPISTPPPRGPIEAGTNNAAPLKQDNSNTDISACPPRRIALNSRLSSQHRPSKSSPSKRSPSSSIVIGKENTPLIKLKTSSSPSRNQTATEEKNRDAKPVALPLPSPLSTVNRNIQPVLPNIRSSPRPSIIKEKTSADKQAKAASSTIQRTPPSQNSLFNAAVLEDPKGALSPSATSLLPAMATAIEPITPTSEAGIVYLPYSHSLMRQRNKRITAPRAPSSCPAPTKPAPEFSTPKGKYSPGYSTSYPRLKYTPKSEKSPDGALSCFDTPAESPTPSPIETTKAHPIASQKMVLYTGADRTPKWIITEATKEKVLPGAVPTADYHDDADHSSPGTDFQPTWLERFRVFLFGW